MVKGNIKYIPLNVHSYGLRFLLWSYYEIPKELCNLFTHIIRGCFAGNRVVARVPEK